MPGIENLSSESAFKYQKTFQEAVLLFPSVHPNFVGLQLRNKKHMRLVMELMTNYNASGTEQHVTHRLPWIDSSYSCNLVGDFTLSHKYWINGETSFQQIKNNENDTAFETTNLRVRYALRNHTCCCTMLHLCSLSDCIFFDQGPAPRKHTKLPVVA